ncbi:MAG: hypothetical protein AAF653_07805 [Chloroflexota bacterium]
MWPTIPIIPRYKLVLCYDIRRGMHPTYHRYVITEFVPALNEMEIYVLEAWHTAYGEYPVRQVEYVTGNMNTLDRAFDSTRWQRLEDRLKAFTTSYSRKIIPYRRGFQF